MYIHYSNSHSIKIPYSNGFSAAAVAAEEQESLLGRLAECHAVVQANKIREEAVLRDAPIWHVMVSFSYIRSSKNDPIRFTITLRLVPHVISWHTLVS